MGFGNVFEPSRLGFSDARASSSPAKTATKAKTPTQNLHGLGIDGRLSLMLSDLDFM